MTTESVQFSVFTKPWRTLSIAQLGEKISGLGFAGIEFPLRDTYQVEPNDAEKGLPKLVKQLSEYGLKVFSVASGTDEHIFAGCAEAGIDMIRIMPEISPEIGYLASEEREKRYVESLLPLCEKYGVKIGIQQHYGNNIIDSSGLLRFLEGFDPAYIGAIWDAAHDALAGQQPEYGLDIVKSHLCMINFKNAFYRLESGPEANQAVWSRYFTLGKHGLASWPRAVNYIKKMNYQGVICLTAEYTDESGLESYISQDIEYVKALFQSN